MSTAGRSGSAVSGRRAGAGDRAQPLRRRQGLADRQPARPHRPALVCAERAVPRSGAAADRAGPLHLPHAVQPGRARSRISACRPSTARPWRPTGARSGGCSPATTICSGERRPGCGSTMCCPTCSASTSRSSAATADRHYDTIAALLASDGYRPRALFERFNIEVIATTDGALDDLQLARDDQGQRLDRPRRHRPIGRTRSSIPTSRAFRPISTRLGELTGCDTGTWARLSRRASPAPRLLQGVRRDLVRPRPSDRRNRQSLGRRRAKSCSTASAAATPDEREKRLFRAQMLTEMAKMSLDDGLVLQIHPGSWRNHSPAMFAEIRARQGLRHPDPHGLRRRR